VASTNVPFTSESKDAVAAIPEIEREITLVLQELGRELKTYLSRRDKNRLQEDRARAVCAIIPELAAKVAEIVDLPVPDIAPIEGKITRKVGVKRYTREGKVILEGRNYTSHPAEFSVYDISPDNGQGASMEPAIVTELDGEFTKMWKLTLPPGDVWTAEYTGTGGGTLEVRGIPPEQVVVVDIDSQ